MRQLAQLEIVDAGDATLATLSGEVDMSNADTLGARLVASMPNTARGLVLDVRGLTYLDSAGVRVVYKLDERLANRGQRLAIVVASGGNVERVLELTGVARTAAIERDVEAALALLRG